MINTLRWTGRLEGCSFLILLLIAMPIKYVLGHPEMVRYVGMAHGALFLAYVSVASYAAIELKWSFKVWLLSLVASVLPLGTFYFENKYLPDAL